MDASSSLDRDALLHEAGWLQPLARSLVFDADAVDDVVQDAWVRLLQSGARPSGDRRAWFSGVLRHVASTRARGESRRRRREVHAARPEAVDVDVEDRAARHRDVVDSVLRLEDPYKDAVLLRYFDGLPPREIAARKSVPVKTVKSWLHRGLAQLRVQLDAEYGDRRAWGLALLPLAKPSLRRGIATANKIGIAALVGSALVVTAWRVDLDPVTVPGTRAAVLELPAAELDAPTVDVVERAERVASPEVAVVHEGPVLRVVSQLDGTPLPGARVRYLHRERSARGDLAADADGSVRLLTEGEQLLVLEAPGYLGRCVRVEAEGREVTLGLAPRASLTVRIVDADGRPASGVEIALRARGWMFGEYHPVSIEHGSAVSDASERLERALVAPEREFMERAEAVFDDYIGVRGIHLDQEGRDEDVPAGEVSASDLLAQAWPHQAFPAVTGADGTVTWSLPAGPGYVVTIGSAHPLHPANEELQRLADVDLEVGEERLVEGRLELPASLRGVLDGGVQPWSEHPPRVALYWIDERGRTPQYVPLQQRRPASEDGGFDFELVRPGRVVLWAAWSGEPGHVTYLNREVRVEPGAVLDLGKLSPLAGAPLELSADFRDERGLPVPNETVFREPDDEDRTEVKIVVSPTTRTGTPWPFLPLVVEGQPGARHFVHGVPSGEFEVRARVEPFQLRRDVDIDREHVRVAALPTTESIELPLVVHFGGPTTVSFTLPEGFAARDYFTMFSAYQGEGRAARREQERTMGEASCEMELRPGRTLLVISARDRATFEALIAARRTAEDRNFAGESVWKDVPTFAFAAEVDVVPGREIRVALEPAVVVTGRVVDVDGNPVSGREIDIAPRAYAFPARGGSAFETFTDRDGRFRAVGLPASTALSFEPSLTPANFETGAPGEVVRVELRQLDEEEMQALRESVGR